MALRKHNGPEVGMRNVAHQQAQQSMQQSQQSLQKSNPQQASQQSAQAAQALREAGKLAQSSGQQAQQGQQGKPGQQKGQPGQGKYGQGQQGQQGQGQQPGEVPSEGALSVAQAAQQLSKIGEQLNQDQGNQPGQQPGEGPVQRTAFASSQKMRYILKILKGEQQNYFGKDPLSFLKITKDNIISTNYLFSLIICRKKYLKQNNS